MPALAYLIEHSNSKEWSEQCYKEMEYLGRQTGLLFEDYLLAIRAPIALLGTAASNPINVSDDDDADLENYDPPGRFAQAQRVMQDVHEDVHSDSFPFVYFDVDDEVTSGSERGSYSVTSSGTSALVSFLSAVSSEEEGVTATTTTMKDGAPTTTASGHTSEDGPFFSACGMDIDSEESTVG